MRVYEDFHSWLLPATFIYINGRIYGVKDEKIRIKIVVKIQGMTNDRVGRMKIKYVAIYIYELYGVKKARFVPGFFATMFGCCIVTGF